MFINKKNSGGGFFSHFKMTCNCYSYNHSCPYSKFKGHGHKIDWKKIILTYVSGYRE